MIRIEVDRDQCEGHGLCESTAPQIYQLDDDGELEILMDAVPPELRLKAEAGVWICPVAALEVNQLDTP